MKRSDIKVGKTYCNGGAGKTTRKVLAIGDEHKPSYFHSMRDAPNQPGVLYEQNGKQRKLYLASFANWAGREVE